MDLSLFTSESQLDKRQKEEDDDESDEDYTVKKKSKPSPKIVIKETKAVSSKNRKTPKRAKTQVKYEEPVNSESSDDDDENLLELSKKAKSLVRMTFFHKLKQILLREIF